MNVHVKTPPALYVLNHTYSAWGDYGDILTQGMAEEAPDGSILLMRTGPFVPPISFPTSTPVLTQAVRELMKPQGFTGFQFRPVVKQKIVRVDWRRWDLTAEEPQELPESGEPEDYILSGEHSPSAANEMGGLWELLIPESPGLQARGEFMFDPSAYKGQDVCRDSRWGHIFVSQRLALWLMDRFGEWVQFEPARAATAP